jgi:hypothetical protein
LVEVESAECLHIRVNRLFMFLLHKE